MCHLKESIALFFISFSTGFVIGRLYLNERRISKLEKNIFILDNKIKDLEEDLIKK